MPAAPREKEVFLDAIDRPTAERPAWVARACAGDPELERRVRALLAAHERAEDALGAAEPDRAADAAAWRALLDEEP